MKVKIARKGLLSDVIHLLPALSEDSEGMLSGGFLGVSASSRTSDKNETCTNKTCSNGVCESTNDTCTNSKCYNNGNNGACTNNICYTTTTTSSPTIIINNVC